MDLLGLGHRIVTSEFDYLYLMDVLKEYQSPRDKVSKLLKQGLIVRVKKGFYVLGPAFHRPFSKYVLANMLYGPSYVSGLSALSFYHMIPERVEIVMSTTSTRNKMFKTPVGNFSYKYLSIEKYRLSTVALDLNDNKTILIATPEKALIETMLPVKSLKSIEDVREWLLSMRIDADSLASLRIGELRRLNRVFEKPPSDWLIQIIQEMKKRA